MNTLQYYIADYVVAWLGWTYEKNGLTNVLLEQNFLVCRDHTVLCLSQRYKGVL